MPALGATDPADMEAKARAELGFSRQLEQPRRVAPHPFLGGTGYTVWYREQQLEKWNAGEATDVGRGAAHVEGDEVLVAGARGLSRGADHAGGGP